MSTVTFPDNVSAAQALVNLWNSTQALGLGFLYSHHQPTVQQAENQLAQSPYVDYFFGKPIKTNFSKYPTLNNWGYDRDAGEGTMAKVANGSAQNLGPTARLTEDQVKQAFREVYARINIT